MKIAMQFGFYREEGTRDEREIMEYFHKYVSRAGVDVDMLGGEVPDLKKYDLVHVFGMSEETHDLCRAAAKDGIPTLVTPFYWNEQFPIFYNLESLGRAAGNGQPELVEKKLDAFYYQKKMVSRRNRQQEFMLKNAKLVFAVGRGEKAQLVRDFGLKESCVVMLPVGIDLSLGVGKKDTFVEKHKLENFVLCVGRLCRRKNQHVLIEATRELDVPLVLIGEPGQDAGYVEHCWSIAHDNAHFFEEVSQAELKGAYQAARAYAMPSMFELPGMAYMPAALAGLPVAATCRGAAWHYLGDHAEYCDPEDEASVLAAVRKCLEREPSKELKDRLLRQFSWGATTVMLVKIYSKISEMKFCGRAAGD